jgi:gamma-glutamylcysteine synthetase
MPDLPVALHDLMQADHLLELYNTKWKRSVDPMYKEFAY